MPTPAPAALTREIPASAPFDLSSDGSELVAGEYVEYERRPWRVGLVNFSRARLDPLKVSIKDGDPFAGSVNVGPSSTLRRLTPEEAAGYFNREKESINMAEATDVAGVPVPAKSKRLKTGAVKQRHATGSKATASKPRAKKARTAAVADKPCKCGCGEKTASFFVAGHDARFKGLLLKIERGKVKKEDVLSKKTIAEYEWKKLGKGEIPTTNYKGEKHKGYDTE